MTRTETKNDSLKAAWVLMDMFCSAVVHGYYGIRADDQDCVCNRSDRRPYYISREEEQ